MYELALPVNSVILNLDASIHPLIPEFPPESLFYSLVSIRSVTFGIKSQCLTLRKSKRGVEFTRIFFSSLVGCKSL